MHALGRKVLGERRSKKCGEWEVEDGVKGVYPRNWA